MAQDRVVICSPLSVYLVSSKKLHTQMMIKELRYIIKAQQSKEFILQFGGGNDIRINLMEREELINLIKQGFKKVCPGKGLKVYGIQQPSLKEFKSTNKNHNFDVEPASKFRLINEEIKAEVSDNRGDTPVETEQDEE